MADPQGKLRLIAQLGSAVAVALSLVFVAVEVRETSEQTALNTAALEVAAYQDLIGQIDEWNRTLLDPEVAVLHTRVMDQDGDWSTFSLSDRRRAESLLFLLFRHADMAFYQYERGVIDEERLSSVLTPFMANLSRPLVRSHWERAKSGFVPAFREYVEARSPGLEN